jgi:hypothetical protein
VTAPAAADAREAAVQVAAFEKALGTAVNRPAAQNVEAGLGVAWF